MQPLKTMAECLDETARSIIDAKPIGHIHHEQLDRLFGGIRPYLIMVPAAPGVGKTTFVHEIGDHWAASGHPVVFFEGELSKPLLLGKSLARLTKGALPTTAMFDGPLDGECRALFDDALEIYRKCIAPRLFICDGPIQYKAMRDAVAVAADRFGEAPLVVCDYAQIVSLPPELQTLDERVGLKLVASQLRLIVDELQCPLIAISSINRANYDKQVAGLDSIGGCNAFEYGADIVCGLSVEGKGAGRLENMELPVRSIVASVTKNRFGLCGHVDFIFDAPHATFIER
jgi:replicative DNA helicase